MFSVELTDGDAYIDGGEANCPHTAILVGVRDVIGQDPSQDWSGWVAVAYRNQNEEYLRLPIGPNLDHILDFINHWDSLSALCE